MKDPTLIAWHQSSSLGAPPPYCDGANPETWWDKHAVGNGGRLEVSVSRRTLPVQNQKDVSFFRNSSCGM